MGTNKHFWKSFMANEGDKTAAANGQDPLEEGLEGISWLENSKRIVQNAVKKTQQTYGEEVGNSITSGVLAIYLLGLLPYASVHTYLGANGCKAQLQVVAISLFIISVFISLLSGTIYHFIKRNTNQKRVAGKINRIMIYYAIAGSYAPVCLSFIGGSFGITLFAIEGALALAGTLFTALSYPDKSFSKPVCNLIYVVMGWLGVIAFKTLSASMTTAGFWLMVAGLIIYSVGMFFYTKKFKFSHMIWHFFVLAAVVCHVLAFVYFR